MATKTTSSGEIIDLFKHYVIGNYTRYPVVLTHGDNSWVWDAEGRRYLDFFPGWGCGLLGHCPPRVVEAVREQVGELIHVPNTWYTEAQGRLAQALSERTDFDGRCFFCNSGTEAVEAAIKLARLHGKPGRYKIISMLNSFHGRTFGALSATGQPKYHQGLEPLLAGFSYAPYGDLDAAAKLIDGETCAILLEPIQGEGGIHLPPKGYLEGLRELADRHKLLLIFDEVQSGMGRTGRWYAHQHWGVQPDVMTLAKRAGGRNGLRCRGSAAQGRGVVEARHSRRDLWRESDRLSSGPGDDRNDRGGGPAGPGGANRGSVPPALRGLAGEVSADHRYPHSGAMIGVELAVEGAPIVEQCLRRQLLINCTHATVLRLLPALTLTDEQLQQGCDILDEVLLTSRA